MLESKIVHSNGHTVEYVPIITDCTYHHLDKNGICINCENTGKYSNGYYMIIDGISGFIVDGIK